ncbi:MAG: sugar MFS transporter [Mangrovibacterium sp.]
MSKTTLQFTATGLVMMLFGITMVVVGTINDFLTSEYQVDKLFIGFCASMLTSGILAGSFLFGSAAERFGYKRIMLLGVLMVIAGIAGIVQLGHIAVIPYLFLLIGLGGGVINGVTNLVVAVLYPVNTGAWLSLLGVFYGVGAFGLPLLTSVLLEQGWGYRSILTWIGASLLIPFVFVLVLRFPEAKRSGGYCNESVSQIFHSPGHSFHRDVPILPECR